MRRRDFLRTATAAGAAFGVLTAEAGNPPANSQPACNPQPFPKIDKLTAYVGEFVVGTKFADVPAEVVALGKKSILDGLGLALSGSKVETAGLVQKYLESFGFRPGGASVLG